MLAVTAIAGCATTPSESGAEARETASLVLPDTNASASPFKTENDYLRELDALALKDKERALALAFDGEHWYRPLGLRAEARRAMQVSLLADLGRLSEARSNGQEFVRLYPKSRYLSVVLGVTGLQTPQTAAPEPEGAKP